MSTSGELHSKNSVPIVDIEFWYFDYENLSGVCDYGGHCLALAQSIRKTTPEATVLCKRGRQGSFEVSVNNKLVYSKLQTMALPNYEEVAEVVNNVYHGADPHVIKGQQPINCVIT